MPIPLPDLDDRRWADLVDEGRALIPSLAPAWTDHNIHDPGVTLIELFAWLTEMNFYRLNQVPPRHRRKFLSLIGYREMPPRPAQAMVSFNPSQGTAGFELPAGAQFETASSPPVPFRTLARLSYLSELLSGNSRQI
jgi:predicted phage baseplate assembly protein